jgi:ATPase involved in DNA repair
MLTIKKISMRNFFSFGNAPQELELQGREISLVLGQNNDVVVDGGDSTGRRNGVGKSALIQGLVFGLYGKSIGNDIKIPNLVNKTNTRNCEVEIEFIKDGIEYRVERGRSPTYFNFLTIKDGEVIEDESRGEKKDTQEELNEILGISQTLFEHIVVLNANVDPFLSLSAQKQRDMIEELLGITQLTEKAELLKDMQKDSKKTAEQEKFKIDTLLASNERIQKSIENLQSQANTFETNKQNRIDDLKVKLSEFEFADKFGFEALYISAKDMEDAIEHNNKRSVLENRLNSLMQKREQYDQQLQRNKIEVLGKINELKSIDISSELALHEELDVWYQLEGILKTNTSTKMFKEQAIRQSKSELERLNDSLTKEYNKLKTIEDSKCPMCNGELKNDHNHTDMLDKIKNTIEDLSSQIIQAEYNISITTEEIDELEIFEMPPKPVTKYSTLSEAKLHEHMLAENTAKYEADEVNIYDDELVSTYTELEGMELKEYDVVFSTSEVQKLEMTYKSLSENLKREESNSNPYIAQIETLKTESLQTIDYNTYNELEKLANHQDFLVKLLLNKDSYVRKRIIEQNITYLNNRLQFYIDKCDSEHFVKFMNDLSVEITLNDQTYDYKQLSRGERTRVNIALSLAFRDTYESLYQRINILFCDEYIDVGLDTSGVNRIWTIFSDFAVIEGKNVFVISHREELLSKTDNILKVVKEDGFSTLEYATLDDIY